jgi:serine/threonine protein kinase
MNAEVLVGKVLGSYTLRRVIGHGSMGAVYLARQSPSQRKVVVKIFLQASVLEPLQYIDFLLRFRHEMGSVASLQHPHILPIEEYEERDGFVYLVMPFVSVRTLSSVLNSQESLPLSKIADYLDQLAGALDYAHDHSVLHMDIKPTNILVTSDDRLLFTDFALTKIMTERQAARIRQFTVGMLDYMAPEQVLGKEAGEKADLYSLGAVLYHMVTGSVPFKGDSLVEVAKKHLQESPTSPCSKRADLPQAAEQAIVRALAKRPADRYAHAQDFAVVFRQALVSPPIELKQPGMQQQQMELPLSSDINLTDHYPAYSLFDPKWRTDLIPVNKSEPTVSQSSFVLSAHVAAQTTTEFAGVGTYPAPSEQETAAEKTQIPVPATHPNPSTPVEDRPVFPEQTMNATDALTMRYNEKRTTGTIIKLTSPAKIVNVPVAGQPGRYQIGLLPTYHRTTEPGTKLPGGTNGTHRLRKHLKVIGLLLLVLLVLGSGTLWLVHLRSVSTSKVTLTPHVVKTLDVRATLTAQANATASANIILVDSLAQNIHNWPTSSSGSFIYTFEDEAYHITDNDNTRAAPAILPDVILKDQFVYSIAMEEIKGDDTSVNNEFGVILRASIQNKSGRTITTFYSFEVMNKAGGEYQFWKYDDSQGPGMSPWKKLGGHAFGNEFHEGQGPKSINTLKITAKGKNFTLLVNGKQAWTVQDSSFASGGIGMLVNLKGTEVAFSNLILTYK